MKTRFFPAGTSLLTLLFLTLVCGCKGSVKQYPVQGKVTVDGQPLTGGQITFHPEVPPAELETTKPADPRASIIGGSIDANGDYKIYANGKEGAPLGKYRVTITPGMMPMSSEGGKPSLPFNDKYGEALKTDLKVQVVENPSPGQYDLKLTK